MDSRFRFVSHAVAGILFSFAMLCWVANAAAQASRVAGTVEGTVKDTSGGAIPGAEVLLRNTSTSQSRLVTTDEEGFFRAEQLPVGNYEVRVEQRGFAGYKQTDTVLSLGQTMRLDIVLVPASVSEAVTVKAQPSAMDPSQTSVVSCAEPAQ